ncbi:MAG: ATP-binding protein [Deltaproteobacteria bacterium]|jgi:hypothetical protein|nr:ATP-binding protein [Deltaproteobacteria bacterium]
MALRAITPLTDRRLTCLVVGKPGIGKTSLLRTVPQDRPAFTVSAESGLLCVQDLVCSGAVQGVEVDSVEDMDEIFRLLRTREYSGRFGTVFIDSLSEISSICLESYRRKYPSRSQSYTLWDAYNNHMMALIKGYRDLQGYDVVMTCLERTELDEVKRREILPAMASQRTRADVLALFDEIFYMTDVRGNDNKPVRAFMTRPFDGLPGKDRSGRLDPIEKPDLAWVKAKIFG